MPLSKAERNALMQHLMEGGLKASDLTLEKRTGAGSVFTRARPERHDIHHQPTDSWFTITGPLSRVGRNQWSGRFRSGTDPTNTWSADKWAGVLVLADKWAKDTDYWASAPDLWALDTATLPEATDNSPFTEAERDEIAKSLDDITQLVREQFKLPDDQIAAIAQAVDGLKEASERIGRKDWKLMVYGAFLSLGLEHAVSSGVVETMFRLAVQGLGHMFGGPLMITA